MERKISLTQGTVLRTVLFLCLTANAVLGATNGVEADSQAQPKGQEVLKRLLEVNQYWLLAPPDTITNYGYCFHRQEGDRDHPSYEPTPVRVINPAKTQRRLRQGITFSSLLQALAKDPERARIHAVKAEQGKLVLSLSVLPPAEGDRKADSAVKAQSLKEPPLRGECGNGLSGAWYGYFSFGGQEAELTIDPQKMVPLRAVVHFLKATGTEEETFAEYTPIAPGHYVPQSIGIKCGDMQFAWKFKVHGGGLWLFSESRYRGEKVAWVDQVVINRPVSELPVEPPASAPKETASSEPKYEMLTTNSVVVTYAGISSAYACAIARTIEAARSAAARQFGFDMPEVIAIKVTANPRRRVQLFTDGEDGMFLDVRSEAGLQRPDRTGTFHIYGFCHEVGHLAMYRLLKDVDWMKGQAKEAWAHYLGSRITDIVYDQCGPDLWPDAYDYRADGMQRLEKSLASAGDDPQTQAVRAWKGLTEIVGDKGVASLFQAWAKAGVDPLNPGAAIRSTLAANAQAQRLAAWWEKAEPALIQQREKSDFPLERVESAALAQKPVELVLDDSQSAGKRSIGGGGHAVRFQAPATNCFLTEVRMYGCRYGTPQPPAEDFHVWLCDHEFKPIADFQFPYSSFPYAEQGAKWVSLTVPPTRVPAEFAICVNFNPTATKGVYANYDKGASGHSFTGLPGHQQEAFAEGNWLLRAKLDTRLNRLPR